MTGTLLLLSKYLLVLKDLTGHDKNGFYFINQCSPKMSDGILSLMVRKVWISN